MRPKSLPAEPARPVRKPEGGYRFISVTQLGMAWFAYESGRIQFRDLRAYFAIHEMDSRRCEVESERLPALGLAELRGLVGGVGGEHLRRSLARLEAAGLLSWSESKVVFSASPDGMPGDIAGFWTMLDQIKNNRRRVPVPRRTVRLIAQAGRPVVVATIVAYLLRCVYMRDGGVVGEGTCKASWVSGVFRVGERNVKAARKFLASIGWVTLVDTPQWHRNRYGGRGVVNLAWERPDSYADVATESAPRNEFSTTESTPPCLNQKPFQEKSLNQKPARAADPAGFSAGNCEEKEPSLRDVKTADLKDTRRLLVLYSLAVMAGLIERSDHGRLLFVMLAEHAVVKGTRNAPGLFMHLLKNKLFHFATNSDEDAAHERLKRHFHGTRPKEQPAPKPKLVPVILSNDARFAAAVVRVVNERRITCEPFFLVKRERPDWTRERWECAISEFEAARFRRFQVSPGCSDDE